MIEVIQPGLLTTIQDGGRFGFEVHGMPSSGPFDPFLARVSNKLVGNRLDDALLEFALVGPTLKFFQETWVAVTGYGCRYLLDEKPVAEFSAFRVKSGSTLQFSGMHGWFGYMAISGGILCDRILNSCSTYVAGNIGNKIARSQQILAGEQTGNYCSIPVQQLGLGGPGKVDLLPGLHMSEFRQEEHKKLAESKYTVSLQSNRMGVLFSGPAISAPHIRRSAPALPGTIQIQASGCPMALGPEGPTTGGYPQIAVLTKASWTQLAQTRPGGSVRFEWTDIESAKRAYRLRESFLNSDDVWIRNN